MTNQRRSEALCCFLIQSAHVRHCQSLRLIPSSGFHLSLLTEENVCFESHRLCLVQIWTMQRMTERSSAVLINAFPLGGTAFKVTRVFVGLGHSEIFQTTLTFMIVRSCRACQRTCSIHSPKSEGELAYLTNQPLSCWCPPGAREVTPLAYDQGTVMGASPYGTKEQQKIEITLQLFYGIQIGSFWDESLLQSLN